MSFTQTINEIRETRIKHLTEAIEQTYGYMRMFPRDLHLPSRLANFQEMLSACRDRRDPDVIYLDELRELRTLKLSKRRA
jgi:Tfp pilus assembly pilus retraction ATPase PilT